MEKKTANKTQQKQVLKLVSNLLTAKRNGNIKREQSEYEKLYSWCEKNHYDIESTIKVCTDYLKRNNIAANMNGIV